MSLKPVNRFVSAEMKAIMLKCRNETCDFVGPHDDAVQHLKDCKEGFVVCPNGCGSGIMLRDLEYHNYLQCPEARQTCEKCDVSQKLQDAASHDCFTALKHELSQLKKQAAAKFGDEYVKGFSIKNVKCGQCSERMHKCHKNPYSHLGYAGNPRCDECRNSCLQNQAFQFHCKGCGYDKCFPCALR